MLSGKSLTLYRLRDNVQILSRRL